MQAMLDRSLGNILLERTNLTDGQLEEALLVQKEKGIRLGEALVQLRYLKTEDILEAISIQLDLPYLKEIETDAIPLDLIASLPINYAKKNEVIPIRKVN